MLNDLTEVTVEFNRLLNIMRLVSTEEEREEKRRVVEDVEMMNGFSW